MREGGVIVRKDGMTGRACGATAKKPGVMVRTGKVIVRKRGVTVRKSGGTVRERGGRRREGGVTVRRLGVRVSIRWRRGVAIYSTHRFDLVVNPGDRTRGVLWDVFWRRRAAERRFLCLRNPQLPLRSG